MSAMKAARARAAAKKRREQAEAAGRTPKAPGKAGPGKPGGLATTALNIIKPEPVHWLVAGRVPLGKLVLIAGDGGHGKSTLTLDLAAAVTRGRPAFGLDYDAPPPGDALLVSCEDDFGDTVVPRLLAAGADLKRIRRVDGVRNPDGTAAPFSLDHYQQLETELEARPDVRLVVVDPAGAYVGRTGVDDHKDSALRSLLGPLAELAARRRVTVMLVKHVNKGVTARAVHRVTGSAAYVNTVRAGFVVCPDKDDDDRKLFLPLKFNVGAKPQGLSYRMESLTTDEALTILAPFPELKDDDRARLAGQLFRIQWEGEVDVDPDDAMGASPKERGPTKTAEAAGWVVDYLRDHGPTPSNDIIGAGEAAGFSRRTLFNAKKDLGEQVRAKKTPAGWRWELSDALLHPSAPLHSCTLAPLHSSKSATVQECKGASVQESASVQPDSHAVFPED
jgi:hypothetical protein